VHVNSADFVGMRRAMVESQLRTNAVTDPRVTEAIEAVARENFVPEAKKALAYIDRPLPLGGGRALNPPLSTARLINEAEVSQDDSVLLVGAATGYAAAVLAQLAGRIVALEEDLALSGIASQQLSGLTNVSVEQGTLAEGSAAHAPYDLIMIDGLVEQIPAALVAQLAPNGRIAAGLIEDGVPRLVLGRRAGDGFGVFSFADAESTLLPGFAKPKAFQF
jgi:protein-L-isoaspartate(D-aspartate) O-methyltransferase